jgi:RNA polymerase sigma-70 factor (ECF subfamily)
VDVPESQNAVLPVIDEGKPAAAPALSRAVLEGVRRREPRALESFFEAYFDRVFGLVYRLLGNRAAAEDVTQEVFYKVHRAFDRLDPARDPMPWLATIAHNACRDYWRSSAYRLGRRSASLEAEPLLQGTLAAPGNPEREMLAQERERLVQQALMELPEALRAPVVLHDYQGLSHESIASVLGIRHDAARKRYSRALAALAGKLRERLG